MKNAAQKIPERKQRGSGRRNARGGTAQTKKTRIGEDALRALTEGGQKGDVPEAAQLYFAGETSPTLLESYFACPYAGFMKYVLRLSEREEGALPARDAGD